MVYRFVLNWKTLNVGRWRHIEPMIWVGDIRPLREEWDRDRWNRCPRVLEYTLTAVFKIPEKITCCDNFSTRELVKHKHFHFSTKTGPFQAI